MSVSTYNNRKPSALFRQLCDVSVAACAMSRLEMNLASASLDQELRRAK